MPVDVYNITTNTWKALKQTPWQLHHFQAVEYKDEIYAICAQYGPYPHEKPYSNIFIYNPLKDSWRRVTRFRQTDVGGQRDVWYIRIRFMWYVASLTAIGTDM